VRDKIVSSAQALLARNPGATTIELAAAAGVGRATLHRYFPSRTALVRAAGLDAMVRLSRDLRRAVRVKEPARASLARIIGVLVAHGASLHFLLVAADLFDDPKLARAERAIDRLVDPVFERAIRKKVLRRDLDPVWLDAAVEGLIYAAWSAVADGRVAADDAPRLVLDALLRGFGARR
jgi:AcrR family transcriptional regulator